MGAFRLGATQSCGILELSDISRLPTPAAVVERVAIDAAGELNGGYGRCPAFIYFSGVVGNRNRAYAERFHANRVNDYGQDLADYISANDLGTVTASHEAVNYSGNTLRVWIWSPKWDALKAIWDASRVPATATTVTAEADIALPF